MAISRVRPGDLITADQYNALIQVIEDHEQRLRALEALTQAAQRVPVITDLIPSNELRVGQRLTVVGYNFAAPADANTVTIAGTRVFAFDASSNTTQLVFGVPDVRFSGDRFTTTITVQNSFGSASRSFTILPAEVIPQGRVTIATDQTNSALGTASPGATLVWAFNVTSETNIAESYQVSLVVVEVTGATTSEQWTRGMRVNGPSGALATAPVQLTPFIPTRFTVAMTVPAGVSATDRIRFSIRAASVNNTALTQSSEVADVVANQRPSAPGGDPRVTWVCATSTVPTNTNPARRVADPATGIEHVEIPFGGMALVEMRATFGVAGDYAHSVSISSGSSWQIVNGPAPAASLGRTAGQNVLIGTVLRLNATATPGSHPEQAVLTVRTRGTIAGGESFESFVTLFIRGYTP